MRTPKELWDAVADIMCDEDYDDLFVDPIGIDKAIELIEATEEEREFLRADYEEQKLWEEHEAGNPFAEELKTYIPGVGMLVTNLGTAESHIFPDD